MKRGQVFGRLKSGWWMQPPIWAAKAAHKFEDGRNPLKAVDELPIPVLFLEDKN